MSSDQVQDNEKEKFSMINSLVSKNPPKPSQRIKLVKVLQLNLGTHFHRGEERVFAGVFSLNFSNILFSYQASFLSRIV